MRQLQLLDLVFEFQYLLTAKKKRNPKTDYNDDRQLLDNFAI